MARYKNVFILAAMLVMAIFIATVVSGIGNELIGQDNREIAAQTCGVSVQVMEATEDVFLINMVNSAQFPVDCMGAGFKLQRLDEEENWQTVEIDAIEEVSFACDLPSGENRSFWFYPVKDGVSVLTDGVYRICKDIHRDMGEENEFEYLTLTTEFFYPRVLDQKRSYEKPVEDTVVATKLARTVLPQEEGMVDYWNPEVTEITRSLTEEEVANGPAEYWQVRFPAKSGDADDEWSAYKAWCVYVSKEDGSTHRIVEMK